MSVYEKLHVRRVVNASANNSRRGGCLVASEVLDAMAEASKWFVDMDELHRQAGKFIAGLTGQRARKKNPSDRAWCYIHEVPMQEHTKKGKR